MMRVRCSAGLVDDTLGILRAGGRRGEERVALWLARSGAATPAEVVEVYEPEQVAETDFFKLPSDTMRALMTHLAATRRRIVAQIHSHPRRAFHSRADAEWAIVRHAGALSLVVPTFARTTTVRNFAKKARIYEFATDGCWELRPGVGPNAAMEIIE